MTNLYVLYETWYDEVSIIEATKSRRRAERWEKTKSPIGWGRTFKGVPVRDRGRFIADPKPKRKTKT